MSGSVKRGESGGNSLIVIHFGELWLKGRNRGNFIKQLYRNIGLALRDERYESLENARDRFVLHLNGNSDIRAIEEKLSRVFGVAWFAPVIVTENTIPKIMRACMKLYGRDETVRITAHRSYKGLKFDSQQLIGEFLRNKKKFGFTLDKDSDNELKINMTKTNAMITKEKIVGAGGLPVGSSGNAIVLLSGGIDSPVASFYAMKKGLRPIYLHLHAYSDNKKAMESKMGGLMDVLNGYYPSKCYFVPAHLFLASIMGTPKEYELVLFKRFAYRMAERLAEKENAEVIVTGESLGQVASQTVKNLIATERGTGSLIMRPLIGFDKIEIINIASKIGTYDISIKSYPDVCSIRARNPSTAAKPDTVDRLYKKCGLDSVITKSISKSATSR
jgi:tRNA uracil 4-sulfurtransferase